MSQAWRDSRISRPGVNSVSSPGQLSLTIGVPHAAASNSRTLGENPAATMSRAGDVQREARGRVEGPVISGLHVDDARDVGRPRDRRPGTAARRR